MDPETVAALRALVDQHRLRIVARVAAGPAAAGTLALELRLPLPAVRRHFGVLLAAGLVERRDAPGTATGRGHGAAGAAGAAEVFTARLDRVGDLGRRLAELASEADGTATGPDGDWPHGGETLGETLERLRLPPEEAKVIRSYLVDGRLATIPAQPKKRDVILRFLLERVFTEDRPYPEKEVNARLALFHPDVASLRRYLVDERHVEREAGIYRRRVRTPGG